MAKRSTGKGKQRDQAQQAARREARQEERRREQAAKVERERARRRRRVIVQATTVVAVVAVIALLATYFFVWRESASDVTADGPPGTDDRGAVVFGEESAPVTVEVISDFGCPACASFEAQAGTSLKQQAEEGSIRLEYRIVAAQDASSPNEFSSRAAAAAGCVLDQGGAELWNSFSTAVFSSQPTQGEDGPSDTQLIETAVSAGADRDEVAACVDDGTRADWADAVDSVAAGEYSQTPSVVVDGERLSEPTALNVQNAIDSAAAQG